MADTKENETKQAGQAGPPNPGHAQGQEPEAGDVAACRGPPGAQAEEEGHAEGKADEAKSRPTGSRRPGEPKGPPPSNAPAQPARVLRAARCAEAAAAVRP